MDPNPHFFRLGQGGVQLRQLRREAAGVLGKSRPGFASKKTVFGASPH